MAFYCGEAMCKASVPPPGRAVAWPVRCPSCQRSLYPGDVLVGLPPSTTELRAELMTERDGLRVSVRSSDFATAPSSAAAPEDSADAALDRLLKIADLEPKATARKRSTTIAVGIALALAVAVIAAVLLARR